MTKFKNDVRVENHGSIILIRPLNDNVSDWLSDNTDGQWFGGALACEPRYVHALMEGMIENGFQVEGI